MRTITFLFFLFFLSIICKAQTPKQIRGENVTGALLRYSSFKSKYADARNVDVWLPASYSKNVKYAVVYMHDGQNLFVPKEPFTGVDWGVDETMTRLIAEKRIRETIVVGIWNTPKRVIEYAPQKAYDLVNRKKIKNSSFVKMKKAESDEYLKFIVEELKPFIDANYSTKPDRDNTFIMGSSMDGLISLYAVSEYPEIFGGAGCISTHFPLVRGVMLEYMKNFLPPPQTHKIYFDHGTETLDADYEPYQKRADKIMKIKVTGKT